MDLEARPVALYSHGFSRKLPFETLIVFLIFRWVEYYDNKAITKEEHHKIWVERIDPSLGGTNKKVSAIILSQTVLS